MSTRIVVADSDELRAACFHLRYEVFVDEQRKLGIPGVDVSRQSINDDLDRESLILAAISTSGTLVGTIRIFLPERDLPRFPRPYHDMLGIDAIAPAIRPGEISMTGRLAVRPGLGLRSGLIFSMLVDACYHASVRSGCLADAIYCDFDVLPLFHALGYRQFAPLCRPDGLHARVPLMLCLLDVAYLSSVDSRFEPLARGYGDDGGRLASKVQVAARRFVGSRDDCRDMTAPRSHTRSPDSESGLHKARSEASRTEIAVQRAGGSIVVLHKDVPLVELGETGFASVHVLSGAVRLERVDGAFNVVAGSSVDVDVTFDRGARLIPIEDGECSVTLQGVERARANPRRVPVVDGRA